MMLDAMTSGKRERKKCVVYNEADYWKMQQGDKDERPRQRQMRSRGISGLPKMQPWQFWDEERIKELHDMELKSLEERKAAGTWDREDAALPRSTVETTAVTEDEVTAFDISTDDDPSPQAILASAPAPRRLAPIGARPSPLRHEESDEIESIELS